MSTTPRTTATDSLAFFDVYRADQDQLEQRLAQLRLVREIRGERELLDLERRATARSTARGTARRTSRLGRWLRAAATHLTHPISSHRTAHAA